MALMGQVIPVTPFQQNCSVVWSEATMVGAVIDPGGDLPQQLLHDGQAAAPEFSAKGAMQNEKVFKRCASRPALTQQYRDERAVDAPAPIYAIESAIARKSFSDLP